VPSGHGPIWPDAFGSSLALGTVRASRLLPALADKAPKSSSPHGSVGLTCVSEGDLNSESMGLVS